MSGAPVRQRQGPVRARRDGQAEGGGREDGMVSLELAVAIPSVVVVLALALAALGLAIDQIRCVDAARVGARSAARGDDPVAVERAIRLAAPPDASVRLAQTAVTTVEVRAEQGPWRRWLPEAVTPAATATAQPEQAAT